VNSASAITKDSLIEIEKFITLDEEIKQEITERLFLIISTDFEEAST